MKIRVTITSEYEIPDDKIREYYGLDAKDYPSVESVVEAVRKMSYDNALEDILENDNKVAIHINKEIAANPINNLED
jgi:hypothetical protein